MTSPDTKPEKAEASAVEVPFCPWCRKPYRHIGSWARSFSPPRLYHEFHHPEGKCPGATQLRRFCFEDNEKYRDECVQEWNAALQSSSSAEADLRALLSSAKATIALLMERATAAEARVKVLEEALRSVLNSMSRRPVGAGDGDTYTMSFPPPDVLACARAALNHGKGEDARAGLDQSREGR